MTDTQTELRALLALQSTRLRGGVPEGWRIDREGDDAIVVQHQAVGLARATNPATTMHGQILFVLADDILQDRQSLTAAPQAPAPEQDAGVVRDAARKALEDLEDAAEEWSRYVEVDTAPCTLPEYLAPHVENVRAAMSAQGGGK